MQDSELLISAVFYAGLVMNSILVALSAWGLWAFFPRQGARGNTAAAWLILAIWVGFLGVGMNVLYWRVFGDVSIAMGWVDRDTIRFYGQLGDFVWKGAGVVSIYLHFYARYRSIPAEDRTGWSPLMMGFYPDLQHWAMRCSRRVYGMLGHSNQTRED